MTTVYRNDHYLAGDRPHLHLLLTLWSTSTRLLLFRLRGTSPSLSIESGAAKTGQEEEQEDVTSSLLPDLNHIRMPPSHLTDLLPNLPPSRFLGDPFLASFISELAPGHQSRHEIGDCDVRYKVRPCRPNHLDSFIYPSKSYVPSR